MFGETCLVKTEAPNASTIHQFLPEVQRAEVVTQRGVRAHGILREFHGVGDLAPLLPAGHLSVTPQVGHDAVERLHVNLHTAEHGGLARRRRRRHFGAYTRPLIGMTWALSEGCGGQFH